MEFQTIASSSSGNAYAVWSDGHCLLLEAGISIKKIAKALGNHLLSANACLISHEHGDHAGHVQQVINAGIPCYMSKGTKDALGCRLGQTLKAGRLLHFCGWHVLPIQTQHDAAEPLGFVISRFGETLVFATDTFYITQNVIDVTIWALECNYQLDKLQANISSRVVDKAQAKRILQSHMSLEHLEQYLKQQSLASTQEIHLLHMSSRNIDKEYAVQRIKQLTGKPVYAKGVNDG